MHGPSYGSPPMWIHLSKGQGGWTSVRRQWLIVAAHKHKAHVLLRVQSSFMLVQIRWTLKLAVELNNAHHNAASV
jgi:hypothetical protein